MGEQRPRLELVAPVAPGNRRLQRLGLGLLLSLVVGFPALSGAIGAEPGFELWIGRFLLTVAASVASVLTLGRLYDRFTAAADARDLARASASTEAPIEKGRP